MVIATHRSVDRAGGRCGMTFVEVMVGLVAAAVLAVGMASILAYCAAQWRTNHAAVGIQRDATLAAEMIALKIRGSARNAVGIEEGKLLIGEAGAQVAFYREGDRLMYDPDTGNGGDDLVLVPHSVDGFTPVLHYAWVALHIALSDDSETVEINSVTGWRN